MDIGTLNEEAPASAKTRRAAVRRRIEVAVERRLSPERTRRATALERLTVTRLSWDTLVRLNVGLELIGRAATAVWVGVIVATIIGIRWRSALEGALNDGRPVHALVALAILLAIFALVGLRSMLGFARWRVQRELWRREAARLAAAPRAERTTAG